MYVRVCTHREDVLSGIETRTPWSFLVVLLLSLPLVAACGGGGGGGGDVLDVGAEGDRPGPEPGAQADGSAAVLAIEPTAIDRDLGGTLTIRGRDLAGPLEVRMVDASGRVVGSPLTALVAANGERATCLIPPVPGLGSSETYALDFRDGDGRDVDSDAALELVREYRSHDGTANNPGQALQGSAGTALRRMVAADYADGSAAMAGVDRSNPRSISNSVCRQTADRPNAANASDFLWQWGQFVDHDIDLTPEAEPAETANILVPAGDAEFDPFFTGQVMIPFHRSAYRSGSDPRQQVNEITAFIDASNVYGSDAARARALRTLDGTGRLRTSAGDLLPFNTDGLPNAGGTGPDLFLAGDVRANEQVGLSSMHTLFVREHNRLAAEIRARAPRLSGDEVYEEARRVVACEMQTVTYGEFLPLLLGPEALPAYDGYDAALDPGIQNVFSTAAYRLGHSMLSSTILRLDRFGDEVAVGNLALRDAYFDPTLLTAGGGIEPVLRGLAGQACQEIDARVVEDVRSFLFGPPGAGGLDLAALNLQRGRDHGLPSYNDVRGGLDLPRRQSFDQVTSDAGARAALEAAYADVDDVDAWIGALAEDHVPGAMVGETLRVVLTDQFRRLRDGDRFWYERVLGGEELQAMRDLRLADVIRRNTSIDDELSDDVFRVAGGGPRPRPRDAAPVSATRQARIASALLGTR